MKLPPPITMAIVAVGAVQIAALASGHSISCLMHSAGVAGIMSIGAYIAHKQQLRKVT